MTWGPTPPMKHQCMDPGAFRPRSHRSASRPPSAGGGGRRYRQREGLHGSPPWTRQLGTEIWERSASTACGRSSCSHLVAPASHDPLAFGKRHVSEHSDLFPTLSRTERDAVIRTSRRRLRMRRPVQALHFKLGDAAPERPRTTPPTPSLSATPSTSISGATAAPSRPAVGPGSSTQREGPAGAEDRRLRLHKSGAGGSSDPRAAGKSGRSRGQAPACTRRAHPSSHARRIDPKQARLLEEFFAGQNVSPDLRLAVGRVGLEPTADGL